MKVLFQRNKTESERIQMDRVLNLGEAAGLLKMSRQKLSGLLRSGNPDGIPFRKVGGRYLFSEKAILDWLGLRQPIEQLTLFSGTPAAPKSRPGSRTPKDPTAKPKSRKKASSGADKEKGQGRRAPHFSPEERERLRAQCLEMYAGGHGLSQTAIAAAVGLSQAMVSKLIRGE